MNIIITGCSSGLGAELRRQISSTYPFEVFALTRDHLDLADIVAVQNYQLPRSDMLINCAGTDLGGKCSFVEHETQHIIEIMTVNLLAPMILTQQVLRNKTDCKIVNVTSTNNKQYWPNDLAYSLSKQALSTFGHMLQTDFPNTRYLEIRLGLTRTNFNRNRYRSSTDRFVDIYQQHPHLQVEQAVHKILPMLFDDNIKFVEVAP